MAGCAASAGVLGLVFGFKINLMARVVNTTMTAKPAKPLNQTNIFLLSVLMETPRLCYLCSKMGSFCIEYS